METRKLYKQGKSTVLVMPAKYLISLKWATQDDIQIVLLPNSTLNLSKQVVQPDLLKESPPTPNHKKEDQNVDR